MKWLWLTCFAGAAIANAAMLVTFHDRFWYAPDEGNYAHVAQRLTQGEILNGTIQDVHPGYINLLNAAALHAFGEDLLSLRYPLVLVMWLQAMLIYLLFTRRAFLFGLVASVVSTSIGVIQFLNPTANWYSSALTIATIAALTRLETGRRRRLFCIGFLVASITLFRQLSGIIVAMGVLTYLLGEATGAQLPRDRVVSRAMTLLMTAGLAAYLLFSADVTGFILFGAGALMLLGLTFWRTEATNLESLRIALWLAVGGMTAAAPLIAYHSEHGTLGSWSRDIVGVAKSLPTLHFFSEPRYAGIIGQATEHLIAFGSAAKKINAAYWIAVPLLAWANTTLVLLRLKRGRRIDPLSVVSVFYALVSLHFQIPIYIYYTAGLSLAAILAKASTSGRALRWTSLPASLILGAVAVHFHAAQPLDRGMTGIVEDVRRPPTRVLRSHRASLWVEQADAEIYTELLAYIDEHAAPHESIFALPSNAELYFMSGRTNPFRFFNSALGVTTDRELEDVIETLKSTPPRMVIYNTKDKYRTAHSQRIMHWVRANFQLLGKVSDFEIYSRPPSVTDQDTGDRK